MSAIPPPPRCIDDLLQRIAVHYSLFTLRQLRLLLETDYYFVLDRTHATTLHTPIDYLRWLSTSIHAQLPPAAQHGRDVMGILISGLQSSVDDAPHNTPFLVTLLDDIDTAPDTFDWNIKKHVADLRVCHHVHDC